MSKPLQIIRLKGKDILPYISDLATLRIKVFKEYPYLYEGDVHYEQNYLQTYVTCPESIMVLVLDQKQVVGASTAIPLEFETEECQAPFIAHGMNIKDIFYFGESVLLPAYRGQNIYRRFFQKREEAAREYGSRIAAFCAVERAEDDPRQPEGYVPLDQVWQYFGYQKHPELRAYYQWREIGEKEMSAKPLVFWLKKLD